MLAGVQPRTLQGERGFLTAGVVSRALRSADLHYPITSLVCLENTHNRHGGTVMTVDEVDAACCVCHDNGLKVHMDGARLFNAAVCLGVPAARLARDVDSVQICLSKGLASPVGSIVAGEKEFIDRARKNRKLLGGGMRQAGVLAACGIISLTKMVGRLAEDHDNARFLADRVNEIPGLSVKMDTVQTNIVMVDIDRPGLSGAELAGRMRERGVWANAMGPQRVRLVTHNDVGRDDVIEAARRLAEIMAGK